MDRHATARRFDQDAPSQASCLARSNHDGHVITGRAAAANRPPAPPPKLSRCFTPVQKPDNSHFSPAPLWSGTTSLRVDLRESTQGRDHQRQFDAEREYLAGAGTLNMSNRPAFAATPIALMAKKNLCGVPAVAPATAP